MELSSLMGNAPGFDKEKLLIIIKNYIYDCAAPI